MIQSKILPELLCGSNAEWALQNAYSVAKVVETPYKEIIAAGKNTYVYDSHTYHTKVPPQGIASLIDYYTRVGDVVLDPFCGSGMTGIAATQQGRHALLCDVSPAAVFIAANITTPINAQKYREAIHQILSDCSQLEEQLYSTQCRICGKSANASYMVWSYGMLCPHCNHEFVLWDVARDEKPRMRDSKIRAEFPCPHCCENLKKRGLKRTRRYPVAIGYKCCQGGLKESVATPNETDKRSLDEVEEQWQYVNLWRPTNSIPNGLNTKQLLSSGINSIDKLYTPRALWAMAALWEKAYHWPEEEVRSKLLWTVTSLYQRVTVLSEFRFWGGSGNTANYNVPAIMNEQNVFRAFERKANTIRWYFESAPQERGSVRLSTQSACDLHQLSNESVDYVFTDPPFGGNINYSEMNLLWESWLGTTTDTTEEAVIHSHQNKGIAEYQELLRRAFAEAHRVLKSNGWMTVIFHNSSKHVWRALQDSIEQAQFRIEGTQTFDKKHGTFKQFVSQGAVGYDLVLHCRKASCNIQQLEFIPNGTVENFIRRAALETPERYVTHYIHVNRDDEFDYRRLYADWLARSLAQERVVVGFEEFRQMAVDIVNQISVSSANSSQPNTIKKETASEQLELWP